jgi:hypothetical protein
MALEWMGATMAFASVVKNPNSSCLPSTCALFGPRTHANSSRSLEGEQGGDIWHWPRGSSSLTGEPSPCFLDFRACERNDWRNGRALPTRHL